MAARKKRTSRPAGPRSGTGCSSTSTRGRLTYGRQNDPPTLAPRATAGAVQARAGLLNTGDLQETRLRFLASAAAALRRQAVAIAVDQKPPRKKYNEFTMENRR